MTQRNRWHAIRKHIIEELTHTSIMLALLKKHFGITQNEINDEILRKAEIDGFDTSEYGFEAERRSENRDLGAEAARDLFPQCFEDASPSSYGELFKEFDDVEIRKTSSGKSTVIITNSPSPSFGQCPKWPDAKKIDECYLGKDKHV